MNPFLFYRVMSKVLKTEGRTMRLPYSVVDLAISEGWTRELSYFLHIKTLFGNGIIYDFSYGTLASKLGVSKSAVYKNVNFLLEIGLLSISKKGHLIPLSNKKIINWYEDFTGNKTGKGLITVKIHKNNLKFTEWNLLARVPISCLKRQKYNSGKRTEANAIRAKVDNGSFVTPSELRKLYNFENNNAEKGQRYTTDVYFISDEYLSKKTGKSISTVRNMMSFWISEGLLESVFFKGAVIDKFFNRRAYEAIKAERPEDFNNTYFYKGNIIRYNKRAIYGGANLNI